MKRHRSRPACLAAAACLLLAACASGHREAFPPDLPAVRDLAALEAELRQAVAARPGAVLTQAGQVSYDGFQAPVWLVRVDPPGGPAGRRVLVLGGLHGNEPAGVAWVVQLARELGVGATAGDSVAGGLPADVGFDLLPLLNPWGWSRDRRHNREGLDVNRDFATFASQEARILRELVRGREYELVLDHHEDPRASGFYLYQYARRDTAAARETITAARARGYPIETEVRMVILRTRDGLIRAPRWGLWYMRLSRQLSATNYLRLENSRRVYTIETPTRLDFPDRMALHRLASQRLLAQVAP